MMSSSGGRGLAALEATRKIREMVFEGTLRPGQPLREESLAQELGVSRNTLRESFRTLTHEGVIVHEANFGVRVKQPTAQDIREIYHVRRLLEIPALLDSSPTDQAVSELGRAVRRAESAQERGDWKEAGTADLSFHLGIVALAENSRVLTLFRSISVELRLAFEKFEKLELIYSPFVARNAEILDHFAAGRSSKAAELLTEYLKISELLVLGAHQED